MFSTSAIWDRATEFLGDNLRAVLPIAAFALFLPLAAIYALQPFSPGDPAVALIVLLCALVVAWAQLALIVLAIDPPAGRPGAVRVATRRFPVAIGIGVIEGVVVLAALLPVGLLLAIGGVTPMAMAGEATATIPPAIGVMIAVYVLVLAAVALWLVARLLPITPVILVERRGLGVFARAFVLTKGLVLRLIGVGILYLVVSQIAAFAAKAVVGTILGIAVGRTTALVGGGIAAALVAAAFNVLAAAYVGKLYLALIARRDGALETR